MATYQIYVDESNQLGKSLVAYLKSIPQVVSFQPEDDDVVSKEELLKDLASAFRDVRLMRDGKRKKKSLQELIDELPDYNN
jgi:hypothetical protein